MEAKQPPNSDATDADVLRLGDIEFRVANAVLDCFVSEARLKLSWGFRVQCEASSVDAQLVAPHLEGEVLFATRRPAGFMD